MTDPGAKDRRLDELLREFRPPPPPDAAALWRRIQPELDARRAPVAAPERWRWRWSWPILAPTLAAATIAAVVFATRPDRAPTAVADPDGPQVVQPPAPPVRHAVQEHFAATERFLRPVLTPGDTQGASPTMASDAASLLAQNDLLRASRAVAATSHRELLDDVELVLTQLAVDGSAGFAELTAGDVRLLDRLRAAASEEARSE